MKRIEVMAVLIGALLASGVAPPAATGPASRPAVDRSSPEKTWAGLCAALKAGDLSGFRAAFYDSTEVSRLFMETLSDVTVATFDLAHATALLGEQGRQMGRKFEGVYDELVRNGQNRKAEIVGDAARWIHAEKPAKGAPDDVIYFRLIKGQWLIDTLKTYELDTDAGRDDAEKFIESGPKLAAKLKQAAAHIRAKKITTVDQMRQQLTEK